VDRYDTPGWGGSLGPFPDQYTQPHVYARDIHSGAGNCVCGSDVGDRVHVQAAPGVEVPDQLRIAPTLPLAKAAATEARFVLGIAYQAGPDPRIAKGADGYRDYFTAEELEKAAWSFLRGGALMGLFHADGTTGAARAVESYIWRGGPWDLGNGTVVRKGDWLIGAICDEQAWQLVKSGRVTGFSPQGAAKRRRVSS
jgi:hypothetical protein